MRPAAAFAAVLLVGLPLEAARAADGVQVFGQQCRMCHGGSVIGPALSGISGAPIASRPGYAYSPALRAKSGTWTDASLDAFLKAPAQFAPGTRMLTAVPSADTRAALIDYLKTLK